MKTITVGYANVASTLALVIALSGTAYAAVVITGADIKNGTVTTKDIKDKSLKLKDFSAGARGGSKGAPGPAGPAGATGATGATGAVGPMGPSDVFTSSVAREVEMTDPGAWITFWLLKPGSYSVSVTADGIRSATGGRAWFNCFIIGDPETGGANDGSWADTPDVSAAYSNISMQMSFTDPSNARVRLFCSGERTTVHDITLTAIKVGAVAPSS